MELFEEIQKWEKINQKCLVLLEKYENFADFSPIFTKNIKECFSKTVRVSTKMGQFMPIFRRCLRKEGCMSSMSSM